MMLSSLSLSTCDSRNPPPSCAIERARVMIQGRGLRGRGQISEGRRTHIGGPQDFSAQRPLNSPFRPYRRLASVDVQPPSSAAQRPSPPS